MQKIDLVYILGKGSLWDNNEIRISLRSVEKNLKGVRNIYVIGENPGFFSDRIIHIYHPDPLSGQNADGNMTLKILRACQIAELSDDFLFMNDDFIIHKPMVACEIPWFFKQDMKYRPGTFWNNHLYRSRLRRTFDILVEREKPTLQYDYHAPMLMNKNEFPRVMEQFDYQNDIGYTFRSLYGNCLELPAIPISGHKVTIYDFYTLTQIEKRVKNVAFVGYNDRGLNNSLKWWMIDSFPKKSKYEKSSSEDKIFELYFWNKGGMNYDRGIRIFEKYYKHKNLLHLFKMGETPTLKNKLNYKLTRSIKEL